MNDVGGMLTLPHFMLFSYLISDINYQNATAIVITFLMNNYKKNSTYINMAMAWEKEFLDLIQNYESEKITVSYMAEVIKRANLVLCKLLTLFYACILNEFKGHDIAKGFL